MGLNAAHLDRDEAFCQSRVYLGLLSEVLTSVFECFLRKGQCTKSRASAP